MKRIIKYLKLAHIKIYSKTLCHAPLFVFRNASKKNSDLFKKISIQKYFKIKSIAFSF